jgi:hypothetical protein
VLIRPKINIFEKYQEYPELSADFKSGEKLKKVQP